MIDTHVIQSDYEIERDKPMPSKHHGFIQSNLNFHLRANYGKRFRVGSEITLEMPVRDRTPDLLIFQPMPYGAEEVKMKETPVGVIEILSPTQNQIDLQIKRNAYFASGVQSYWLVMPEVFTVFVYTSPDDFEAFSKQGIVRDEKLGIEMPLSAIFE